MRTDLRRLQSQLSRRHGARLAALSMLFAVGVALGAEPQEWLERMNHALTTRNYIGVFTHNHGGRVETLRIIHRVRGRDVSERLLSLDGPGREFIRQGDEVTCYFPDRKTVLVERRAPDGPLLGALPALGVSDSQVYEIRGGERERLLGRKTRVVALQPRDEYRYGYRLWIDEETSMPLKTQLCGASGEVIEQIVFSNIDLPERIPDSMFKPQVDASTYRWLRADRQLASVSTPALWDAMKLPPGFRMTTRSAQTLPGSSEPATHLVFTDGIASVSVFVEPRNGDSRLPAEGPARVGSSSAFSTVVDGHQITVVGEVPPNTVQFIATQVKAMSSKSPPAQGLGIAPNSGRK
ncbi:MAG TPA: MucB/RseB C-terminal domain-containing protein [Steroidobacteraceae bacterium]|jgi:sigma-E factor negative regulatory protein RseB|nr:MucB/RseB C-terminal domain-containing protein [Steroidobacteraceae bacterium]